MTDFAPTGVAAEFDLAAFLDRERERINAVLNGVAPTLAEGAPAALRAPVLYALGTPGKRLRPIL